MVTRLAKQDAGAFEDDRRFFTEAVERDAQAFQLVMAAYKRPKEERAPYVEEALHGAALAPLEALERACAMRQRLEGLQIPGPLRFGPGGGESPYRRSRNRRAGKRAHQSRKHSGRRVQSFRRRAPRKMPELALLNCRQLVTLAGPPRARIGAEMRELAIIPDGAMLVRDGRIAATGTRAAIERLCTSSTEIIDAGGPNCAARLRGRAHAPGLRGHARR